MALLDRVWEIAYRRSRPLSVQKDSSEDSLETMSFGDHLEELRTRLIRSLLVVVVFASVALVYQSELMTIVTAPHRKAMLQIESSRVVKALSAEVSELSGESKGLDVQIAGQSLKQAISRGDWWQRWDRFRESAPGTGPLSELIALVEERVELLDGTLKTGDPLLRIPQSIEYCISLLAKISQSDKVPWGGQGTLEELQSQLNQVLEYWQAAQRIASSEVEVGKVPAGSDVAESDVAGSDVAESDSTLVPEERIRVTKEQLSLAENKLREMADRTETIETRLVDWSNWYEEGRPLVLLAYTEAFFAYIKLGLFLGLICALPWISAEVWQFIAAGLYPGERKSVRPFLPVAFLLLAAGVNFAYWVLVPVGLSFLGGYGDPSLLATSFTLKDYMGLVFTLVLGMGLIFQLPLLMVLLTRSGIVAVSFFREYRKVAIMTAVVFGAFLTPPDVVTQMLMAGPLVLLYELGIFASLVLGKPAQAKNELDEPS